MKKVEDLKKDLRPGDYGVIQELSDVPRSTINAIFQGHRNADTPQGRKVLAAADKLIESRKQLLATSKAGELGDTPSKACA